jgi:hypothetical protein
MILADAVKVKIAALAKRGAEARPRTSTTAKFRARRTRAGSIMKLKDGQPPSKKGPSHNRGFRKSGGLQAVHFHQEVNGYASQAFRPGNDLGLSVFVAGRPRRKVGCLVFF